MLYPKTIIEIDTDLSSKQIDKLQEIASVMFDKYMEFKSYDADEYWCSEHFERLLEEHKNDFYEEER